MVNTKDYLRGLIDCYSEEVLSGLDFWADHGMDWEEGGIVTYLDRDGNWYLDEKQGWFTGRAMYSFARGYSDVCRKQRWLDAAENLYDFMVRHQFYDERGKLYHYLDRHGNPCSPDPKAGEIISQGAALSTGLQDESFAVMGLAELYRATGREDVKQTLYRVFDTQQFIYRNPYYYATGKLSDTQPVVPLSWLMSLLCTTQTIRECDPEREELYTALLREYREQVFRNYYDPERKLITEKEVDCPGHSLEVAWFLLAEGMYTKDQELIDCCAEVIDRLYAIGWDQENGGLSLFRNFSGGSAFEINQDLKHWWPQNELENALMYAYIGTGDEAFLKKYQIAHEWIFAHFADRERGEWYGYLNYDGKPISRCKGDNQKGAFHVYRSCYAIMDLLKAYQKQ